MKFSDIKLMVNALCDLKGKSFVDQRLLNVELPKTLITVNQKMSSFASSPKSKIPLTEKFLLGVLDQKKMYTNSILGGINPKSLFKGLKER